MYFMRYSKKRERNYECKYYADQEIGLFHSQRVYITSNIIFTPLSQIFFKVVYYFLDYQIYCNVMKV